MNTTITKRDLVEGGVKALLEKKAPSPGVTVQHHAGGGVSQVNLPQVVEIAQFMAACQEGVPPHCRGNVGICLRVTFQAVEWQMSPFSVADMSYVVNGRLAYMSQLLHAVIEGRAPIVHRLECEYIGEGDDLQCIVRGYFVTGDMREYKTPKLKDIRIKNSPLWRDDPEQQIFYYGSRAWGRKWCPDILLGCYTKEEIQRFPEAEDHTPKVGLHARLAGSPKSDEGHRPGHVAAQLDAVENGGSIDHNPAEFDPQQAQESAGSASEGSATPSKRKRSTKLPRGKGKGSQKTLADRPRSNKHLGVVTTKAENEPTTIAEYLVYARHWIKSTDDKVELGQRWARERKMRNDLGMTAEDREPLEKLMQKAVEK